MQSFVTEVENAFAKVRQEAERLISGQSDPITNEIRNLVPSVLSIFDALANHVKALHSIDSLLHQGADFAGLDTTQQQAQTQPTTPPPVQPPATGTPPTT